VCVSVCVSCVCVFVCKSMCVFVCMCGCVGTHPNKKTKVQILKSSFFRWAHVNLSVNRCGSYLIYVLHSVVYICAHMPTCLTLCEYRYTGDNFPPYIRGFEHLTTSYLNTPCHRHRQALRRIRYLHLHPLARSRVPRSRHRMR